GVDAAAQFAVRDSVKKINRQTDREPNKETDPSFERQAQHQDQTKDDAENRKDRIHRNTKRARAIRFRSAQDHDSEANQNEGEELPNVSEVQKRTDSDNRRDAADKNAGPNRRDMRGAKARMNSREVLREQTIASHRHKNPRLTKLKDEQHGSDTGNRARTDERLRPRVTCEGGRNRRRIAEIRCVLPRTRDHCRHQDVKDRTDDETGDDTNWHVALRVPGFLRGCRHSVKPDKGEEDNGGAAQNSAHTGWNERMPIGRMNHERAKRDHEHDDGKFDDDYGGIGPRALANSINQEHSDGRNDCQRRKIQCERKASDRGDCCGRIIRERFAALRDDVLRGVVIVYRPNGEFETKRTSAERAEITGPTNRHRHVADGVLENEVPADYPGDQFTERGVGISVSRARDRNHRSELGITERGKATRDSGQHE